MCVCGIWQMEASAAHIVSLISSAPRRYVCHRLVGAFSPVVVHRMLRDMEHELTFRITLAEPPAGIDFGLQKGKGNSYEVVQKQRSKKGDLNFEFDVRVKDGKNGEPVLLGPFVQGPTNERFVYIDIGTAAGQLDSPWTRRLKIPLRDISWDLVNQAKRSRRILETRVPGTAKDGTPSCATVKPFAGWKLSA